MRPGEFWEAMDAHNKEKEADRRHGGELARGVALRLFNLQVDKKSRISDPAEFWPMPWDEPKVDEELERLESMTNEEKSEEARRFLERIKR
jgi:hypothetical protein